MLSYSSITKGVHAPITLIKSELFELISDNYFSIPANVKNLIVIYKSDVGGQREILNFDLLQTTPIATFFISNKARGNFLLDKLILSDFDGGVFVIPRSQLPQSLLSQIGAIVSGVTPSYSFKVEDNLVLPFASSSFVNLPSPISKIILTTSDGNPPVVGVSGGSPNTILQQSFIQLQNGSKVYLTNVTRENSRTFTLTENKIYTPPHNPSNPDFGYSFIFSTTATYTILRDGARLATDGASTTTYPVGVGGDPMLVATLI